MDRRVAPDVLRQRLTVAALCVSFLASACGGDSDSGRPSTSVGAAPDSFRVAFETTRGSFAVDVIRAWSPHGADRLHELIGAGYFTDVAFFRVLPGFIAQFGMHGDPAVNRRWEDKSIPDDPVRGTNARGTLVFATAGPNTRANQLFINLRDNRSLDADGFSPIGRVVEGMSVVDSLFDGYGEGPVQSRIARQGNRYLKLEFPQLDYVKSARMVGPPSQPR
jgi:peptidyl-prolyl cis-trans isomerase A (cyclophilin A)